MYLHRLHDQYIVIRDRVDVLEEGTQETNRKLGIVEFKVDELMKWTTGWYQQVERHLNGHDERFDTVDERFEAIDGKLAEHDKRFEAIDGKLAEHDKRFEAIDERFDTVDERFDGMDRKFDELKALLVDALERKN